MERSSAPEGDDTAARVALHGLALRAGEPDAEPHFRRTAQRAFLKSIKRATDPDIKAFLIRQLEFFADDSAVSRLDDYVTNPVLCEPASRTILAIGGNTAVKAFRRALPLTEGRCRLSAIQALGELRDSDSAAALITIALEPSDAAARLAALRALGEIGAPIAGHVLLEATRAKGAYERSQADTAYLTYLRRLTEGGFCDLAVRDALDYATERADDEHIQCAVLGVFAACPGEASVDALLHAVLSDSVRVRRAAARNLVVLPADTTVPRLTAMLDPASPEKSREILHLLGKIGDASAMPALRRCIGWDDTAARAQAVRSLGSVGGEQAVSLLVELLGDDRDGVSAAAVDALSALPDTGVDAKVAQATSGAAATIQIALIEVLGNRRAKGEFQALTDLAVHGAPDVRERAVATMGILADRTDLPALILRLKQAESDEVRQAAEKALISACRRINDPATTAPPVVAALTGAAPDEAASLLRILGAVGGENALAIVREQLAATDQDVVRDAAIRVLSDWRSPAARPALLDIVTTTDNQIHKVLALRGYVRLIGADDHAAASEKIDLYGKAMRLAARPEEKRLVVAGMGALQDRAAFPPLLAFMNDAGLKTEAATAVITVAESVRGEDSIRALETVLDKVDDDRIEKRARQALSEIDKYAGCIVAWELAGPYTDGNKGHTAIFPVVFPPETAEAATVAWKKIRAEADGRVDLKKILGGNNRAAYLRCNVIVPDAVTAQLEVGSDDGIKVWLNGAVVHENNVPRPFKWCEDRLEIGLRKGVNTLLLKITQGGGDWAANARVQNAGGGRIPGMNISLGPVTPDQAAVPGVPPFGSGAVTE
jgi:HEAT repeat protein